MGRAYLLIGSFLIGVSFVGVFSLAAYAFPNLQAYGFWLSVFVSLCLIVGAAGDDFFCQVLKVNQVQYIGGLITVVAVILIGCLIQWVR